MDEIYELKETVLQYRKDQKKLWALVYSEALKPIAAGTVPTLDTGRLEEIASDLSTEAAGATLATLREVNHNNLDDIIRQLVEQKVTLNFLHKKQKH